MTKATGSVLLFYEGVFLQLIKFIGEVSKVKSSPKAALHQVGQVSEGPGFYSRFYQYFPGKFPLWLRVLRKNR